jgi:hypothetical protein
MAKGTTGKGASDASVSDEDVWLAIRYLDPEALEVPRNRSAAIILIALAVFLLTTLWALLYVHRL